MTVDSLDPQLLERVSRVLGECVTGTQLSDLLAGLVRDQMPEGNTKWRRIQDALVRRHESDGCGNNILKFIQQVMSPVRFIGRNDLFEQVRNDLNEGLAFCGISVNDAGQIQRVPAAQTLGEAAERAGRLKRELQRRAVHADVLRFCRPELMQANYFHAVLEATKSVAEKVRSKVGLLTDGAALVDEAFSLQRPRLALNTLRTESEQSEQKGFANLLRGILGTFRNPTAHAAKVNWPLDERDALDVLTMLSYVHHKLDNAVVVR